MKRFRATLSIGYPTADRHEDFEFGDDVPDEEIEEEIREWAMNYVEWSYEVRPTPSSEDRAETRNG